MDNIQQLLNTVSTQFSAFKIARQLYASQISPEFRCFNYIEPDEMRLSAIIADLLNPNGAHAQGDKFLQIFLECIGLSHWNECGSCSIATEIQKESSRFDITLEWNDRIIVIENKPWASDGDDQLLNYVNYLKNKEKKKWHIIYLTQEGREPDSKSISAVKLEQLVKNKEISLISYNYHILTWIEKCHGICESERFRWFLGELKLFIITEFNGESDMQELQAIKDEVLKNADTLTAALNISRGIHDIKIELMEIFKKQMVKELQPFSWMLESEGAPTNKYYELHITFYTGQLYFLTFEFERTQWNELIFGFAKENKNIPDNDELFTIMESAGLGTGKKSHWWPWWAPMRNEIRDWEYSTIPWLKIQDGSLAKEFVGIAKKCYDALDKSNKLDLLKKNK